MKQKFTLFILICIASIFSSSGFAQKIPDKEYQALISFYSSVKGLKWDISQNNVDEGNWEGVIVSNGHVTSITLNSKSLKGKLPVSIEDLAYLETLNISGNAIEGTIPKSYENLGSLKYLYVNSNKINDVSASLPSKVNLNITSQNLVIDTFLYKGKDVVIELPRICLYNRSTNTFSAKNSFYLYIDNSLKESNLTASENGKLTIPKDYLSVLKANSKVYLYQNSGTAIYTTINFTTTTIDQPSVPESEYKALVDFYNSTGGSKWGTKWDVSKNNLSQGAWHGLSITDGHITAVNLPNNKLAGRIPASITDLKYLTTIDLSSNDSIFGVPPTVAELKNLKSINLYNTKLKNQSMDSIFSIESLTDLNLNYTNLTGKIPVSIGNLKNIKTLNLSNNQFSGSVPQEIASLAALENLNLTSNLLENSIPKNLENLSNLKTINLTRNKFKDIEAIFKSGISLSITEQAIPITEFIYEGKDVVIELPRICLYNRSTNTFSAKNTFYLYINNSIKGSLLTASESGMLTIPKEYLSALKANDKIYLYQNSGTTIYTTINFTTIVINQPVVPESEFNALVDFYKSTGGSKWHTKWDVSKNNLNEGAWSGLSITDGHITALSLPNNNLAGRIPASIADLKYLTTIDLSSNDSISGIPPTMIELKSLKSINLYNTKLKNQSMDSIFSIESLNDLNLSYTNLTGKIPVSIGNLKNIKVLNMSNNKFSGTIPQEIASLTALENINLSSNLLEDSIPKNLENLSNLKTINLIRNKFKDIEAMFKSGISLSITEQAIPMKEFIYDGKDVVIGLPRICLYDRSTNAFTAKNIFYLYINSSMKGSLLTASESGTLTIPKEYLSGLKANDKVYLYQNSGTAIYTTINFESAVVKQAAIPESEFNALVDFYNSMGGSKWYIKWDVSKNNLNEGAWYGLTIIDGHITAINLPYNSLKGTIPTSIADLKYLTTIDLASNDSITGIPASIAELKNLKSINLYNTKLKVQAMDSIFAIESLTDLNLSYNNLTGNIPVSIGNLKNIKTLNLSSNQFSGSIPQEITSLVALENLNLAYNQLEDSIPKNLENLVNLKTISLSSNKFKNIEAIFKPGVSLSITTQTISVKEFIYEGKDVVIELPRICVYERDANTFSAKNSFNIIINGYTVGHEISNSYGQITIPGTLLENLNTGDKISISQANGMAYYSTINFEKTIISQSAISDDEFQVLKDLYNATDGANWNQKWDIAQNDIHKGGWHGIVSDKGHVVSVDLSYNNLQGELPSSLNKLKYLKSLTLSYNKLTGKLPLEIGEMTVLEKLDLAVNILDGIIPQTLENLDNLKNVYLSENKFTDVSAQLKASINLDIKSQSIELPEFNYNGKDVTVNLPRICFFNRTSNDFTAKNKFEFYVDKERYTLTADTLGKIIIPDSYLYNVKQNSTIYLNQITGSSNYTKITFRQINLNMEKVPDEEFKLLGDLYLATDGQNWTNKWDTGKNNINDGGWYGITVSNGHITEIDLSDNNLSGCLPDTILSQLPELRVVKLANNNLTGGVSDKIMLLTKLDQLDLSGNKLNGIASVLPSGLNLNIEKQTIGKGKLAMTVNTNLTDTTLNRYNHTVSKFETSSRHTVTINNQGYTVTITDQGYKLINLMNVWNIPNNTVITLKQQTGSAINSITNYELTYKNGDSNFDDAINILDAQHSINYIVDNVDRPFNYGAADLNLDKKVNLLDIVLLIEEIQNNVLTESDSESLRNSYSDAVLSIENGILYLESASSGIAAFDIRLKGIHKNEITDLLSNKDYTLLVGENNATTSIIGFSFGEHLSGKTAIAKVSQSAKIESALLSDSKAQKIPFTIKDVSTGIDQVSANSNRHLYNAPNPFRESTTFVYNLTSNTSKAILKIYSSQGQLIKATDLETTLGEHKITVDLSNHPSGIYLGVMEISDENGKNIYRNKLIKK